MADKKPDWTAWIKSIVDPETVINGAEAKKKNRRKRHVVASRGDIQTVRTHTKRLIAEGGPLASHAQKVLDNVLNGIAWV